MHQADVVALKGYVNTMSPLEMARLAYLRGEQMQTSVNADHSPIFHMAGLGIPWATIIAWIAQAGLPKLLNILAKLIGGNPGNLNLQQIIAWVESAIAAVLAGQPLPPLPTPTPTPIAGTGP